MKDKQRHERWAWWFSSFALGPDTANASFWSVAFFALAAGDALCGQNVDGLSSGADGEKCTSSALWNETVFSSAAINGSACLRYNAFGKAAYHNLNTPACQDAMAAYRNYTKTQMYPVTYNVQGVKTIQYVKGSQESHTYTCNCTDGPYAFLGGT